MSIKNIEQAKAHLEEQEALYTDGLYNCGWHLGYTDGDERVVLDGDWFTVDDLMAIAIYMEHTQNAKS